MQVLAVLTVQHHESALAQARRIGLSALLSADRANAPLSADATHWLNEIWDQIELAVDRAMKRGLQAAQPILARVNELVDEVLGLGSAWVDEVLLTVRTRLSVYLRSAIEQALTLVQQSVVIGGQSFRIDRVVLSHTISLSSSIKASLTEVCEFVGEGQIELSAEYCAAAP